MKTVEKNDIDISQLFRWTKKVEITDVFTEQSVTVYIRIIGDADLNRARAHSWRMASQLRKNLNKEDSMERESLLTTLEENKDKSSLLAFIRLLNSSDVLKEATAYVEVPAPKEPPSDSPMEEYEKYQAAVDSFPERYQLALEKKANELLDAQEKELKKKSIEALQKIYEQKMIDRLCLEELNKAFYDMVVFLATYKDEKYKIRAFGTLDDFENSHTQLKERLIREYQDLEIGMNTLKA